MADLYTDLTPTSELEAINLCLDAIGESPVQSLDETGLPDVDRASSKLREASRELQARGWSFNREYDVPFTRNPDGRIPVPANTLAVDTMRSEGRNAVQRGGYLYDLDKHTDVWDRDVKVDVIRFLSFDDLPQHARTLIARRAARRFARSVMLVDGIEKVTADDEMRAQIEFRRTENRVADRNIFRAGPLDEGLRRTPDRTYRPGPY